MERRGGEEKRRGKEERGREGEEGSQKTEVTQQGGSCRESLMSDQRVINCHREYLAEEIRAGVRVKG